MEQEIEKLEEIRSNLMIELEKAEVLIRISQDETITGDLSKVDLTILTRIVFEIVLISRKRVEDFGRVLIEIEKV